MYQLFYHYSSDERSRWNCKLVSDLCWLVWNEVASKSIQGHECNFWTSEEYYGTMKKPVICITILLLLNVNHLMTLSSLFSPLMWICTIQAIERYMHLFFLNIAMFFVSWEKYPLFLIYCCRGQYCTLLAFGMGWDGHVIYLLGSFILKLLIILLTISPIIQHYFSLFLLFPMIVLLFLRDQLIQSHTSPQLYTIFD